MLYLPLDSHLLLWQIPRRALLVEAPILKVPATHPHQHPDLVRFRRSVC